MRSAEPFDAKALDQLRAHRVEREARRRGIRGGLSATDARILRTLVWPGRFVLAELQLVRCAGSSSSGRNGACGNRFAGPRTDLGDVVVVGHVEDAWHQLGQRAPAVAELREDVFVVVDLAGSMGCTSMVIVASCDC